MGRGRGAAPGAVGALPGTVLHRDQGGLHRDTRPQHWVLHPTHDVVAAVWTSVAWTPVYILEYRPVMAPPNVWMKRKDIIDILIFFIFLPKFMSYNEGTYFTDTT